MAGGMDMTTPQCSLCGAAIPEGAPHESWEWDDRDAWRHENPDAPDPADSLGEDDDDPEYLVTLYGHAGCYRLHRLIDVSEWEEGSLQELVGEWVDRDPERARQAEDAAEGCEWAIWSVRMALRERCDCRTVGWLQEAPERLVDYWRRRLRLGEDTAPTVAVFRERLTEAAAKGVMWVATTGECPDFSPLTGCPGHGYEWEESP